MSPHTPPRHPMREQPTLWNGRRVLRTDERVGPFGRRFLRRRAESLVERHEPYHLPSYHLRVEKVAGCPLLYEVVAYQNRLDEQQIEGGHP